MVALAEDTAHGSPCTGVGIALTLAVSIGLDPEGHGDLIADLRIQLGDTLIAQPHAGELVSIGASVKIQCAALGAVHAGNGGHILEIGQQTAAALGHGAVTVEGGGIHGPVNHRLGLDGRLDGAAGCQRMDLAVRQSVVIHLEIIHQTHEAAAGIGGVGEILLVGMTDEQCIDLAQNIICNGDAARQFAVQIQFHSVAGLVIGQGVQRPQTHLGSGCLEGSLIVLAVILLGSDTLQGDHIVRGAGRVQTDLIGQIVALHHAQRTGSGVVQTGIGHQTAVFIGGLGPEVDGKALVENAVEPCGVLIAQAHIGGIVIVEAVELEGTVGQAHMILTEGGNVAGNGIHAVVTAVLHHIAGQAGGIEGVVQHGVLGIGDGQHGGDAAGGLLNLTALLRAQPGCLQRQLGAGHGIVRILGQVGQS